MFNSLIINLYNLKKYFNLGIGDWGLGSGDRSEEHT